MNIPLTYPLAAQMKKYKRARSRILGQHFLKSPGILNKIIDVIAPGKGDVIIEIGAGKGALTFPLAERAGKVIAIEKDHDLISFLREKAPPAVSVVAGDALDVDFLRLLNGSRGSLGQAKLVGNLPYSISSPILFRVIKEKELFNKCVFLVQKEVAERICASAGSKKYAPLSILLHICFISRLHFVVRPGAFAPSPKVDSALISLDKRTAPLFSISNESLFLEFLRKAFKQRRKTLWNNLTATGDPSVLVQEAFQKIGLERTIRPEQLTIAQYVDLFDLFHRRFQNRTA